MKAWRKYDHQVCRAMLQKYRLRKAALATAFALLLCIIPLQAAEQTAEVSKVFKVIARTGDGKTAYTATAFYVGPTTLATAAHTFKKTSDQWIIKDGREVRCRLAKVDIKLDLALLECDESNAAWYRLVGEVTVIGFPGNQPMESNVGKIDSDRVHAKIKFTYGMSGGPVVNQYGDVEGVAVQQDWSAQGKTCKFIPASVLADFISGKK